MKKKNILLLLIALIILFNPTIKVKADIFTQLWLDGVKIDSNEGDYVFIDGEKVTSTKSGNGWSYNATTKTLTLNNYNSANKCINKNAGYRGFAFNSPIVILGDVKLELVGTNVINHTTCGSDNGIFATADLEISGNGSLSIIGDAPTSIKVIGNLSIKDSVSFYGDDFYIGSIKSLTINDDVEIYANMADLFSEDKVYINGGYFEAEGFTIWGSKDLIMTGGNIEVEHLRIFTIDQYSDYIGTAKIEGGTINANVDIYVQDGNIQLDGGTINCGNLVYAEIDAERSFIINKGTYNGNMIINQTGNIDILGGTTNIKSISGLDLFITGGKLTINDIEGTITLTGIFYMNGGEIDYDSSDDGYAISASEVYILSGKIDINIPNGTGFFLKGESIFSMSGGDIKINATDGIYTISVINDWTLTSITGGKLDIIAEDFGITGYASSLNYVDISNSIVTINSGSRAIYFIGTQNISIENIIKAGSSAATAVKVEKYNGEKYLSVKIEEDEPIYIKGDLNKNNKIDLPDIILLLKKYLGTESTSEEDIQIGDIDIDGKLGLKDVILLLRTYLGTN